MINYVYYNNGNLPLGNGIFVTAESANGTSWSTPTPITIDGTIDSNAADADVVVLSNGTFLLSYTTLQPNSGNPVPGVPIYTATSTDGINFTNAQPAFTLPGNVQASDPSIVQLANGTFLMSVGNFGHPGTIPGAGVSFYTSTDGKNYIPTGVTLPGEIAPSLLLLSNGDVRVYESVGGGIGSFISTNNGQTWTQEAGLRLALPLGADAGLVSVVQSGPSQWLMVYQEPINPSGPSGPNNDQLVLATSTDGLNFTITQTGFEQQAGSPDIVTDPAIALPAGPLVSSLSAVTDTHTNYASTGHTVTVTMTTSEAVTVTGTPTLQFNDNEVATYTGGSGSNTLTFIYAVQSSDNTADLQVTGLNLPSGATIADQTGHGFSVNVSGDLAIQINTTTVQQEILGLYMALYNRAAEFPGYSFWIGNVDLQPDGAGVTIANSGATAVSLNDEQVLGQAFVNTQATFFNQTYASLNDSQFINALYVNIGGNAGDPGGIAYWASLLAQAEASGESVQAARAGLAGQFVHDLIGINLTPGAAALGLTTAQYNAALVRQETINNKIAVSLAYSNASQGPGGAILDPHVIGDAAYQAATNVLQAVTFDPATVTAAITGINNVVAHQDLTLI